MTLHPHSNCREVQTTHGLTVLRRFAGPIADELFLLTTPADPAASASSQCESAYEALREALAVDRVSPEALTSETAFASLIDEDAAAVVAARRRAFEPLASAASPSVTTLIGQPPLDGSHRFAIAAAATVPHGSITVETSDVRRPLACSCGTCRGGARGRLFRIGDETHFRAANVHGVGDSAFAQAYDMFEVAEQVLAAAGMTFRDVQRTWIYLRDIDRDYDALNQARRQFFLDSRLERRPASTGVQGIPVSAAHDFALSLYAVTSSQSLDVTRMSTPTLNEAWTYGAEFSRGLRVVDANKVTLHISGTASIDEGGRTVHVGDLPAQVERTLRNIETLLSAQRATFGDVVSAVAYVKHPADAPTVRSLLDARGFTGFPCALVEAPLCRRELLCEIEAVALLPLALAPKTR